MKFELRFADYWDKYTKITNSKEVRSNIPPANSNLESFYTCHLTEEAIEDIKNWGAEESRDP